MRATFRCLHAILCAAAAIRLLCSTGLTDDIQPIPLPGRIPQAPPVPPPIEIREAGGVRPSPRPQGPGDTLYSIGQPTDEEQLYLEYLNRARADPTAEGIRLGTTTDPDVLSAYSFFSVDIAMMESQFAAIAPAPPLVMNSQLMTAARLHSGDMFTNEFQGHVGSTGLTLGQRAGAQGYTNYSTLGENVFSYSDTVFYGHAGFEVDWGPGTGGMQTPPGHRNNIHNAGFREVGVGVVDGSNGTVGPQLVTQDFGTRQFATPLITGVVYYDFNGNNFYDVGEGVSGVNVEVEPSTYYAVTAGSGGYAVPVPGNGTYTVTFTAPGLVTNQQTVVVTGSKNVKVDYLPSYSPPVISGPDPAAINQNNTYTFTPVGGASGYDWERTGVAPFTAVEGAENGLTDFTTSTSSGYNVIAANPNGSGNVFHLAHPSPADQVLTYNRVLLPGTNSQIQFKSRLGTATATQIALVQISTDSGATWTDVFSQAGNDQPGETSFSTRTASLSAFNGMPITVRFVFDYTGGTYYTGTGTTVGWAFDDLFFTNAEELTGAAISSVSTGTSFVFNPASAGNYLLRVRANIGSRNLSWGPAKRVTASNALPPPVVSVTTLTVSGGQLQIDFDVANYRSSLTFQLLASPALPGTWNADSSATLQTLVPNSRFRFTTPLLVASQRFFRVQASP